MAIIGMRDVCWGFDETPLLENVTFQIEKGERVCLVGRNGVQVQPAQTPGRRNTF